MVKLNSSRINYSHIQTGGTDIRFYDADNQTELPFEIDTWNTSGDSIIWVKVPRINKSSDSDYIWMYYGDDTLLSDVQDAESV